MLLKLKNNDILVRAVKTFVQAFLATVAVGVANITSVETAQAVVIAGVSAGISAVWNFVGATK